MKQLILLFLLCFVYIPVNAQKPLINDSSYLSWTTVENGNLSPNGKFAYYRIANEPVGQYTWVILSTDKKWEYRSSSINQLNFSADSRYLYAMRGDSLIQLKLSTKQISYISTCKSYALKSDWLIYAVDSSLIIRHLKTGNTQTLNNVLEYTFTSEAIISQSKENLQWTDLKTALTKTIYKGAAYNIIFDPSGNRLAFGTNIDSGKTQIWYYDKTQASATCIASGMISLDDTWRFSEDGQDLFFNLRSVNVKRKMPGPDIWNYKDLYLLSEYKKMAEGIHSGENLSILNIASGKIRQLLSGDQKLYYESGSYRKKSDVLIVQSTSGRPDELSWNKASHLSYYLCFTKTGKLIPIRKNLEHFYDIMEMCLSPDNDFLVYYDFKKQQYVSYAIETGISEVISRSLKEALLSVDYCVRPGPGALKGTAGIVGWITDRKKIIVHGTYDLWELDLENKVPPKNITAGIGTKNQLIFSNLETKVLDGNKKWILTAFNMRTKDTELYSFHYKTGKISFLFRTATLLSNRPTDAPENIKRPPMQTAICLSWGIQPAHQTLFTRKTLSNSTLYLQIIRRKSIIGFVQNWLHIMTRLAGYARVSYTNPKTLTALKNTLLYSTTTLKLPTD